MNFAEVSIDQVRDYWNSRPCNLRHSPAPVGTKEYFDQVEARKYFVEPNIPPFANFNHWDGKRVLEIGCGLGTDTMNFARAGATVVATDLSDESIFLAKQRAEVLGLNESIQFLNLNAEELSSSLNSDDSSFDLVYSFGVIHHSPHPEKILSEARKQLKPGGTLKIMVYNRNSWKVLWIILRYGFGCFWKAKELTAKYSEAQTGCPVTYAYSKSEISNLVTDLGFIVDDVEVDHIFPYKISDYKQYRYNKTFYWRWMPAKLFRRLEQRFGWHLMLTAHLPKDSKTIEEIHQNG